MINDTYQRKVLKLLEDISKAVTPIKRSSATLGDIPITAKNVEWAAEVVTGDMTFEDFKKRCNGDE